MKKAVCYYRVSTENQVGEDKFGLPAQRDAVESYADRTEIEIVGEYEDDGISGSTLDRPGLQQMLKDAAEKTFDCVLVAKGDRVARDLYVALFIEKELLVHGIEIISVSEPMANGDPMSKAFRQMMAVFAELEKDMITARMSGGRKQKARGGGYAGGRPAIGYQVAKGQKALEVDGEKIATVQRVFALRNKRPKMTLQRIADILNKEGHTTAQGKQFQPMQVKRILDRKALYSGLYHYAGIEAAGQHDAIIGG
jgi:site-specific DNA recombinase